MGIFLFIFKHFTRKNSQNTEGVHAPTLQGFQTLGEFCSNVIAGYSLTTHNLITKTALLFKEIIGLEDTKRTLIQSVKNNHVAHAQLFRGNPGSANLAMALAYATYVNCEDKQAEDACGR